MTILLCKWDEILFTTFRQLGCDIVLVADEYDCTTYTIPTSQLNGFYRVKHFDSIDEICAVAIDIRLRGICVDHVVSHAEFGQYGAGLLEDLLYDHDQRLEIAIRTRDKRWMKEQVRQAGVPTAASISIPFPPDERARARVLEVIRFPCVAKPANGFGTCSSARLGSIDEYDAYVAEMSGTFHALLHSRQLIVEEFIYGEECHIDAVWRGDEALFFCVSKYFAPRLTMLTQGPIDCGYQLPADQFSLLYGEALSLHRQVNRALWITQGITHCECFFDAEKRRLVFSEIASRVAGGVIDYGVRARFGRTMREMWAYELCGKSWAPVHPMTEAPPYVGQVAVSPERSGVIARLPQEEELRRHGGILDYKFFKKVGDEIDTTDRATYCLWLIIGAASEVEFRTTALDLHQKVRSLIIVEPYSGN